VRFALHPHAEASGADADPGSRLETAPFVPGRARLGPLALGVSVDHAGASASCEVAARNAGEAALRLDALVVGLRWTGGGRGALRFLRHGWQSWSETGGCALDPAGDAPFPSGSWLRGMFHAQGELPSDRSGWHESHLVSVAGASGPGPACLAGVLEREGFGCVYLRPTPEGVEIEVEIRLEVPLAAGEERTFDPIHLALGRDANQLLESFADLLGRRSAARTAAPFQAGWCSWYHFFHGITEEALRRNLDALAGQRHELPIQVVQLDDGYQRAIGDWLETNEKFPSGLVPLASAIRDAGFQPGIWTAPFCVTSESRLFRSHRDWLLRRGGEPLRGLHHAQWTKEGWVFVLDPSRDEVAACTPWLREQLAIIRPDVVVTLGGSALKAVSPGSELVKVHGRVVAHDAFAVVPLYHPAMARYGPRWTARLRRDFRRLREVLPKGSRRRSAKTK